MSVSKFLIQIESDLSLNSLNNLLSASSSTPKVFGQKVRNYMNALLIGARSATVKFGGISSSANSVAASLAGTFTGAPTAADTVTVNGVAFTARASGATGNEFNIGGSVTITAANLAAAINASASTAVSGVVVASSSLGVVTISCLIPGYIGNAITVSESCANFTFAGSATALAGGVGNLPSLSTAQFAR